MQSIGPAELLARHLPHLARARACQRPDISDDIAALRCGEAHPFVANTPIGDQHTLTGSVNAIDQQAIEGGIVIGESPLNVAGRLSNPIEGRAMAAAAHGFGDHAATRKLKTQVGRPVSCVIVNLVGGVGIGAGFSFFLCQPIVLWQASPHGVFETLGRQGGWLADRRDSPQEGDQRSHVALRHELRLFGGHQIDLPVGMDALAQQPLELGIAHLRHGERDIACPQALNQRDHFAEIDTGIVRTMARIAAEQRGQALAVRDVLKSAIKPGIRADATMKNMDAALGAAGYGVIEFNKPNADDRTDVVYGFHPVGNTGHDIGPSLTTWQPLQATFELYPTHIFSFEYFAYTPIAEWGGKKLRIPIEDDAILMEEGIQFLHPANYRLLVIK